MKEKLKKILWFFANPRLLLCLGIAWMITNGWSYIFVAVGTALGIGWMAAVGGAYLTFLWVPFTPEKILTVIIAIFLLRKLFPGDEKTLKILIDLFEKVKATEREAREKWKKKRAEKKNSASDENENAGSDNKISSGGEKSDDGEETK